MTITIRSPMTVIAILKNKRERERGGERESHSSGATFKL